MTKVVIYKLHILAMTALIFETIWKQFGVVLLSCGCFYFVIYLSTGKCQQTVTARAKFETPS